MSVVSRKFSAKKIKLYQIYIYEILKFF
jgi:hypothetical protein